MKNIKKIQNIVLFAIFAVCILSISCTPPSPLYGTWADNTGSQIVIQNDGTFTAKLFAHVTDTETTLYEGTYAVQLNALTFTVTEPEKRVVTEWDIRGNILYLYWTDDDGSTRLVELYRIA